MEKDVIIQGVFNLVTSGVCWRKQELWEVTDKVKQGQVQWLFIQDQGIRTKERDSPERPVTQSGTWTAQIVLLGEAAGGAPSRPVWVGIVGSWALPSRNGLPVWSQAKRLFLCKGSMIQGNATLSVFCVQQMPGTKQRLCTCYWPNVGKITTSLRVGEA